MLIQAQTLYSYCRAKKPNNQSNQVVQTHFQSNQMHLHRARFAAAAGMNGQFIAAETK